MRPAPSYSSVQPAEVGLLLMGMKLTNMGFSAGRAYAVRPSVTRTNAHTGAGGAPVRTAAALRYATISDVDKSVQSAPGLACVSMGDRNVVVGTVMVRIYVSILAAATGVASVVVRRYVSTNAFAQIA